MKIKFYTCPMHPEVKQEKPGLCIHCGMNLVQLEAEEKPSEETHKEHDHKDIFLMRFWVSLILTIPVVLYSDIVWKLFEWRAPYFVGSEYMPAIFGSILFFYGGWIFLSSAWRELKAKMPGMMTLIALAITTA